MKKAEGLGETTPEISTGAQHWRASSLLQEIDKHKPVKHQGQRLQAPENKGFYKSVDFFKIAVITSSLIEYSAMS